MYKFMIALYAVSNLVVLHYLAHNIDPKDETLTALPYLVGPMAASTGWLFAEVFTSTKN